MCTIFTSYTSLLGEGATACPISLPHSPVQMPGYDPLSLQADLDSALNWGLWRQHTETETRARICRYRCISIGRGRRGKAGSEERGDRTGNMPGAEGRRGQRTGCLRGG